MDAVDAEFGDEEDRVSSNSPLDLYLKKWPD